MELGLSLGVLDVPPSAVLHLAQRADRLGIDSLWVSEAYGADAVSFAAYLASITDQTGIGTAVLQMPARTPAAMAMSAMSLDLLSEGRLRLGLGVSGPQVVEGWHGIAYGRPLARTREYVAIVREAIRRERPLRHEGEEYRIPYEGPDSTGLGKPLKSMLHPLRHDVPIYLAAIGPRNVQLAAEIADGWLPMFFSPDYLTVYGDDLAKGRERRSPERGDLALAPTVQLALGDDLEACRDALRPHFALYIGGMGARGRNFYHATACRMGYEQTANAIQDHFLAGRRREAAASVPAELIDEAALVGPIGRVKDRLAAWSASAVDTLIVSTRDADALEQVRNAVDG